MHVKYRIGVYLEGKLKDCMKRGQYHSLKTLDKICLFSIVCEVFGHLKYLINLRVELIASMFVKKNGETLLVLSMYPLL